MEGGDILKRVGFSNIFNRQMILLILVIIKKALKYYINAINHTKQEKLLYERILNIYFSTNELNQVINYSNKAIEYFPIEPIFYYYKGLAFFYKKD